MDLHVLQLQSSFFSFMTYDQGNITSATWIAETAYHSRPPIFTSGN